MIIFLNSKLIHYQIALYSTYSVKNYVTILSPLFLVYFCRDRFWKALPLLLMLQESCCCMNRAQSVQKSYQLRFTFNLMVVQLILIQLEVSLLHWFHIHSRLFEREQLSLHSKAIRFKICNSTLACLGANHSHVLRIWTSFFRCQNLLIYIDEAFSLHYVSIFHICLAQYRAEF